ncbi:hypothetical protein B0T25DRAFT_611560 [Lasiosphaeria hispida]|uniref:Uncharacterized protein n=1 Tax=Lasiosphaeria hispida TaxID=260671 RepID=A0AAJ0MD57_9PEZI|nr:hypothetical protein B0T25DRAFT_611560 [Lasiosphaeria hispida]
MVSSSLVSPMPPLPNKRAQGTIGADLIVTYHSDLAQCEILPPGSRYTNAGNFKAGTFLPFSQPEFVLNLYPRLLSTEDGELSGIPLLLSMFNAGETDDTQSVQVSLALPRDGGLTPIIPRVLSGNDESVPWPTSSVHTSFAGPIDLDIFYIREDVWHKALSKTSVFVKLGSYLLPESDRPPHKGVHVCHVLVLFPLEQQPWSSLLGWMRQATKPFPRGSWIVCSGRILGVLNRELIQGPQVIDSTARILVILPDDWEFIRQSALSGYNVSVSISSNVANEPPTTPRPAGPGGVASRNPFSSPSRGQKEPPPKNPTFPTPDTTKDSHHEAMQPAGVEQISRNTTTTDVDPVTVLTSSSDVTEHDSDVEQLLDDQLVSTSATPTRKRKGPDSPGSGRNKRTTAGKRKAQLYD